MAILLQTLALTAIIGLAKSCSITSHVKMTFFGFPDNDPAGPETAYNCGGRNNIAGGTGTYNDPLTCASDRIEFAQCELFYSPYLKKYLRVEDSCEGDDCNGDKTNGIAHIDIWTGSSSKDGGQAQLNCEDDLTPDLSQTIIRAPQNDLGVDGKPNTDPAQSNRSVR
ncbi:hypothetical protein LTS15_000567 [Exophiala xenobiotica]|nr:hypothetical protein LTS15_000567 [Exophiala xenobiotica]